jgi:dTDP-glucose pyrophosphorylase/histidinol phosphatase-like enzyme
MIFPRQCAIFVGGLGKRLGPLTAETPKPLLDCGGRPFLMWILRELSRYGIDNVILLAGFKLDAVAAFAESARQHLPKSMRVTLSAEPFPAGTGGALWHARNHLDDCFLLLNGDSWFDTNLARFVAHATTEPGWLVRVLLRETADASRYGVVERADDRIRTFHERSSTKSRGMMNTGIYVCHRGILDFVEPICSLEKSVLPKLAERGLLTGDVGDGYFVDIGIPQDYSRAKLELPPRLLRPAVFFQCSSVLSKASVRAGSNKRFRWLTGAREAFRLATDAGFHAFVLGSRVAQIGESHISDDSPFLQDWMMGDIHASGGTIDEFCGCASLDCEAASAAIPNLLSKWEVDIKRSFLVGGDERNILAANAAGIASYLFSDDNVCDFLSRLLS